MKGRIIDEILGDCAVWTAGDGPNGPWVYESLSIEREGNTVLIRDVDGELWRTIHVGDLPNGDRAGRALRESLDRANRESLDSL